MAGEDEFHDDNPPPPPPPVTPTQQAPHTLSTIKLPILKKGEYDIWAMKMEHYLGHTDYPIWEVIQKGNGPVQVSTDTNGQIRVLPPKTAEEILARERERKARTTLLMSIPEDHLAKFHKMTDAKEMWEAIKSRFGGNDESKKMQKYILKQQFESFSVSISEGLHKGYDRFQSLLSQLEIHGAGFSTEDANQKFLRSLPASWSQVSLIMRTKPGVDTLSFDDLYNNLRVFESDVKGSTASSSSTQNVAFVSSESTSSTNDVSTAYGISTSSGHNSQNEGSSSYTDELKYSFFANQSSGPQLDHEDLEQVDEFDLEEMDLKWQVAMISMRLKKFYKNTGRKLQFDAKEPVGFDKTKEEPKALVTIDGEGVDWTGHAEDEQENFALMAYSNSGSNTKVWRSNTEDVLSYENEVFESVFDSRSSDVEDSIVNDRFAKVEGMLAVPPPMTRIYMPPKSDFGIDESNFTYETLEFVPKPAVNDTKAVSKPKVWSDAPIIEEYEEIVKEQNTCSPSPKADKRDWNGLMSKKLGLGYGFTKKACFVCGSFSHLIRDCDFHEKRMAKQVDRTKRKGKGYWSRGKCPVWNNDAKIEIIQKHDDPQKALKNKGIVDSGCSKHMTGNKAYLVEYQDYNGGPVAFGGSKGQITGKGKIITRKLDFDDVYFVKELKEFNLFSVSQICDKKNKVLFIDSECLVLFPGFKLLDENQVLLRVPRQNNMYSFNLENIIPSGGLACLIAKATVDESNKWHRRLGHVNFKNLNKLVKGNLVRGLPSKIFQNDHTCVACQKGKQHKASCKAKVVSSISQPLQLLHMDLFGPTSVRSINHKTYCLVITDDFSRFSWVFFLRTKDETSGILKDFIRQIENQLNQKVKTIRCDNGTEFKNRDIIEFCGSKGIKREYSNARTPQQNGVAERKNRTLIEAARTMLADSFLPNTFWAEAVSTACYVLNRVLVTKPQNKTPYELITGKIPIISYIRPFGCHVTILNTIDHLGKFKEKSDEAFLFGKSEIEAEPAQDLLCMPLWSSYTSTVKSSKAKNGDEKTNGDTGPMTNEEPKDQDDQAFLEELERLKRQEKEANDAVEVFRKEFAQCTEELLLQAEAARAASTNTVNTVSTPISTASPSNVFSAGRPDLTNNDQDDSQILALEDIYNNLSDGIFTNASYDDEGAVADFINLETTMNFKQGAKYTKVLELILLLATFKRREEIITRIFSTVCLLASFLRLNPRRYLNLLKMKVELMPCRKSCCNLRFRKFGFWLICLLERGQLGQNRFTGIRRMKENGYIRGTIDKTLFIKKDKNDIMLVQVYVDDIIFGSTKKSWCDEFEALMKSSQDKYVAEILKKFDFKNVKTTSTLIETQKPLTKDEAAIDVDVKLQRDLKSSCCEEDL
ncbi:putative ribonuclease H-like domain-containing protein [Tanacetum coccineum]